MKTKAALALSLTGILLTGSAALAVNSPAPGNSPTGISDDVKNVLVTDDSATRTPAPFPAGVVSEAAPKVATKASDDQKADDSKASAARNDARPAEPGDDNGGSRTTPEAGDDNGGLTTAQTFKGSRTPATSEPGDDKGGLRKAPEPGDDSGGHGGHGGHGSDD